MNKLSVHDLTPHVQCKQLLLHFDLQRAYDSAENLYKLRESMHFTVLIAFRRLDYAEIPMIVAKYMHSVLLVQRVTVDGIIAIIIGKSRYEIIYIPPDFFVRDF